MFPVVYRVIQMALLSMLATPTIEKAFSPTKIIKTELCNNMSTAAS
jgi:hypothetical protein